MLSIEAYGKSFSEYLSKKITLSDPENLYAPVVYIMGLGGKRLRPVLTLMAADIFGGKADKALDAALAIEVFHNFSLVHDDIMDDAPLRRGKQTVHEKWDLNTGILSGDAMLIMAYRSLESYDGALFKDLTTLFSKTAIEVCEGQQYDVDFETRDDVTEEEYLLMIKFKTAVLVAAALKMGALIGEAKPGEADAMYDFGLNLGIAFQLKDDYLDVYGDPATFGKQTGGDIIENKKTFLYLKSLQMLSPNNKEQLLHLYSITPENPEDKIASVTTYMTESGADQRTLEEITYYTNKALATLDRLSLPEQSKNLLREFAHRLMNREF